MITATVQINQVQTLALKEALALASNKEILVQVLEWDSCGFCSYEPGDILAVKYKEDVVRVELTGGRATHLSADQFLNYWELIQANKRELLDADQPTQEMIVEMAKSSGTAIWDRGCKLGYVVRFASFFYAVSETLVYGKGFQHETSRHSSFQLAHDALIEQSWEEVA